MEKLILNADTRDITGKKVKKLRREGILPANLFGKKIDSVAVQVNLKEFSKVYNEVRSTGIVTLKVADKEHPVLISAVQADPRTDAYLHADLFEVNLKDKIVARVPLAFDGEAPVEKSGQGTVIMPINDIEVESLPMDIPHEIRVDISGIENLDQTIQVKDLDFDKSKVEMKTDPETVVLLVQESRQEEEEAPAEGGEVAAPEVTGEKKAGEEAEGGEGDDKKED
jgi:large subunit ribosomal protein L25